MNFARTEKKVRQYNRKVNTRHNHWEYHSLRYARRVQHENRHTDKYEQNSLKILNHKLSKLNKNNQLFPKTKLNRNKPTAVYSKSIMIYNTVEIRKAFSLDSVLNMDIYLKTFDSWST